MLNYITALYLALFLMLSTIAEALEIETIISTNHFIYDSFQEWTKDTPCEKISDFNSPYANRGTVELIIICQALDVAGYKTKLKLKQYPNYERALIQAKSGDVHISAETLWEDDIDEEFFYKTSAIIKNGEFEKGIYTLAENTHVLKVGSLEELQALRAVMLRVWKVDWKTLQAMKIKTFSAPNKINMFKMIKAKRIDFTILEFSHAEDMSNQLAGIRLVPVPNIKVGLQGTRYFVVSKKSLNAEALYNALNRGITKLRETGMITRALTESGFINQRVKFWNKVF
ncbi:hypothetical protein EKO29_17550 [Colwellia sp. Arc7-635]|jgi:hypothetical protein|uniref:hypothetical protein n=1 Tax=Colwellia sp. Arc7-635 TaxID=2497879 RepID=UPI000F85A3D1|nr:hypothetical protein [Colwellia sp. Arc7-635]AZQ85637.1 hypothetical protein EKO29_17550 [Colwellia sp. Arc7-635]